MPAQQKLHKKCYQNLIEYYKFILPTSKIDLKVNRIERNLKFIFFPSAWLVIRNLFNGLGRSNWDNDEMAATQIYDSR